ncbi:MAG: T9SS type A sorting domain-containing protein, partial [Flavobacteriales bacterium]
SGGQSGVMGGYEVLANPVPAADMVYRHVSRGFINPGGFAGDQTVIPNTITADQEYSVTYNYTIPSTIREGLLGFAAIVTDKETGVILNAAQVHGIENVVGVEEFSSNFSITPNPTNDVFTLNTSVEGEATVQIINSLGQVVATYNNNLEANATYDVSAYEAGVYFVNVTVGNQVATQRLVIE